MVDRVLAAIACLALLIVVGVIGYNELYVSDVQVIVNLKEDEDPFMVLRQLVPNDSKVTEIREIDREKNKYELTVSTKREKLNLLEWIKKSHKIENVEIKAKMLTDQD
jgi:hypothetical protein